MSYWDYWGKARPSEGSGPTFHLLPYHSLDVAAVAAHWLKADEALMRSFLRSGDGIEEHILKAWVLFFVALHDLGKFDIRFQLKARDVALNLNPLFSEADASEAKDFDHGSAGLNWFIRELPDLGFDGEVIEALQYWMIAVFGHHGRGLYTGKISRPGADDAVIEHNRQARREWSEMLRKLFLTPGGIQRGDVPPVIPLVPERLAGFCSVCDWLGSNTDFFPYEDKPDQDLNEYFLNRQTLAEKALYASGMLRSPCRTGGMNRLFPELTARGIQSLADEWPKEPGLTLIEAPTGSGKTEAALAYASRLLAAGLADSIIFALPTQATANAMLSRLEKVAGKLFPGGGNVVLAHGQARFNRDFIQLKDRAYGTSVQGGEEAFAQCAKWLAASRKRVFLGQVGVCTIDQVLLSVLPIRHHFIRAFGVRKSVLIIDEIHAYDSYMNGLLDIVLKAQRMAGGSAILLSATLPSRRREQLFAVWGVQSNESEKGNAYPLVSHAGNSGQSGQSGQSIWESPELLEEYKVEVLCEKSEEMLPQQSLLDEIVHAARSGARVVVICNLVAEAQKLARRLREISGIGVDLFHSRFRFCDRQRIEAQVLSGYGKERKNNEGRILIATQVVEQSLDLDFDWMITQLCPVDLLFQRLGRLHRHSRQRPAGFEPARCIVLVPIGEDYGRHTAIYGDIQVLWRTQKLLERSPIISFPGAYREWIEAVYGDESWPQEPEYITMAHQTFMDSEDAKRFCALNLGRADANLLADTDGNVAALTRDGEMSLSVIPVVMKKGRHCFLDGTALDSIDEREVDEALNLQAIPAPHSWRYSLPESEDGLYYLPMESDSHGGWISRIKKSTFTYHPDFGLERGEL